MRPPESETPMPSDVDILRTTPAGQKVFLPEEEPLKQADAPRQAWTISQAKSAIDEIKFLLFSHPSRDTLHPSSEDTNSSHIQALNKLADELSLIQTKNMVQGQITSFFSVKNSAPSVTTPKASTSRLDSEDSTLSNSSESSEGDDESTD
ncbi:hypothetical protein DFH28DRAFT_1130933 [Melampsora americana]|nr:hypothetical protein DFH28DRAFT_1130933 [Melampsora americana]